jgi:Cdc6-like AAA superfamily ATPase
VSALPVEFLNSYDIIKIRKIRKNKKKTMNNPFKPSFGDLPPELVGRNKIVRNVERALKGEISDPSRFVLLTGARGSGKTVMLGEISEIALQNGFITVNLTASKNLTIDLFDILQRRADHILTKKHRKIKSINLSKFGITYADETGVNIGFRARLEQMIEEINNKGAGVLFTIDEIYKTAPGLEELSTTFQHFKQEGRNVAVMLAGLPKNVSSILSEDNDIKNLTFLRRAEREYLGDLDITDIAQSYRDILVPHYKIDDSLITKMAEATQGYAFLIQLVGYYVIAESDGKSITESTVDSGITIAKERLAHLVFESSLLDLSQKDREILNAIAELGVDDIETADIRKKLNITAQYLQTYKKRLIESGVIEEAGYGKVKIALPYLREYLLRN